MTSIKYNSLDIKRQLSIYGPNCHICGLIVDLRPNPNCRIRCTRDHLKPKSLGGRGKRSLGNIRLAHSYCNAKRGNGEITDDLRWFCKYWVERYVGLDELERADQWFRQKVYPGIRRHIQEDPKVPDAIKDCGSLEEHWAIWA